MRTSHHPMLKAAIIPLILGVIFTQRILDPQVGKIHEGEKNVMSGLSTEFVLGPMLGLQQAIAGALWVRADEFFHEGDYDAILPIVRMVTWMDPHQIDVYITGAWHLAYNFTDANERSDRRYIPAAQKLLEEGDQNNNTIYDIAFELGWQNNDKIKNYIAAEKWYQVAVKRNGTDQQGKLQPYAPMFVSHQLAHALEREGKIDECIEQWKKCLAISEEKAKQLAGKEGGWQASVVRDSERHNLELTLKRKYSRYVHEVDYGVDAKRSQSTDMNTGEPHPADAYLSTDSARDGVPVGSPRLPATARPWETAFDARVTFPSPRVMEPRGKFNIGDGARVTIRLHDEDWREIQLTDFKFDIDQSQTLMQDAHSVRAGMFGRKIDMSKDPKMYSFSRPYYYLVFEFDPRGTSPFIQDKIGWSGEGMTDKRYLYVDNTHNPPDRIIRKVFKISKEQVMGSKSITDADVVPNDEYARIVAQKVTK